MLMKLVTISYVMEIGKLSVKTQARKNNHRYYA